MAIKKKVKGKAPAKSLPPWMAKNMKGKK